VKALPAMAICSLFIDRWNPAVLYATTTADGKALKSTNGGIAGTRSALDFQNRWLRARNESG